MAFEELVIAPKNNDGKGRAFRAMHVSSVMADALWDFGVSDKHERPVYACFAGSDGEIRPFVANLLTGRPAISAANEHRSYRRRGSDSGYEFMRSVGYKVFWQRHDEGTIATIYLPELLALDPGMVDPKGIKFVVVQGANYLATEAAKMPVEEIVSYARNLPFVKETNEPEKDWRGHVYPNWVEPLSREVLTNMVPLSYLFTLYLGNRSRAPIPPDGKFYLQFMLACFKQGLASLSSQGSGYHQEKFGRNESYKFVEVGVADGCLAPGVAFMATHEEIESVLAAECADYFRRVK